MQPTNNMMEFISKNDQELRYMVSSLCGRHQVDDFFSKDIVQEFYQRCLTSKIIESYNPNYKKGKSSHPQLSTYLYSIVANLVRSFKNSSENRVLNNRYNPPAHDSDDTDVDDIELTLRFNRVAVDYENVLLNNDSENPDSLKSALWDFERKFANSRFNRRYMLRKRKNKNVTSNTGLSVLDIYNHLKRGMSSHEIAELYGVSDMFICHLKKYLAKNIKRHGIQAIPQSVVEVPVAIEMHKPVVVRKEWTDADEKLLLELRPVKTQSEIALILGRSPNSIGCKLYKMKTGKSRVRKEWTDSDEQQMLELHPVKTQSEIATLLGRSRDSIKCRLYRMKAGKP